MRVALVLTGSFRNLQDTYDSINYHLLSKFDNLDVFFYGCENRFGVESNLKFLTENFNIKKAVINEKGFYDTFNFHKVSPQFENSVKAFYNVKHGLLLKKEFEKNNNFEYDLVIRSRTDLFWFREISDEELEMSKKNILTPWDWAFRSGPPWNGPYDFALSDLYAISNSEMMDIYGNCYDYICDFIGSYTYHPEGLLGHYLRHKSVPFLEVGRHIIMEYPIVERNGFNSDDVELTKPFYHPKLWNGLVDFGVIDVKSTTKLGFALHNLRLQYDK